MLGSFIWHEFNEIRIKYAVLPYVFAVRIIFKTPPVKYFKHGISNIMRMVLAKTMWIFLFKLIGEAFT